MQLRQASKLKKYLNQQNRMSASLRQLKRKNTNDLTETDNLKIDVGISENDAQLL
jgi:hypothetical protein